MAFTELEKQNIKEKLLTSCEESWGRLGYKKTNIDDLCGSAGISKGAFYLFFPSKEDLFFDVIVNIQVRLVTMVKENLGDSPTKETLGKTLKAVYREYSKIPFLFEMSSPDFISFMNKLSKEKIEELAFHGNYDVCNIIQNTNLKYKVDKNKGNSAFAVLFMPNVERNNLPCEHWEVIDFMIDTLIETVFQ